MSLKFEKNIKYKVLLDDDRSLVESCSLADDFMTRLLGLMFKREMGDSEGLLIFPCNSIHTFFMNFAIDLVFIDRDGNAVADARDIKPGKILQPVKGAWATLELNSGHLDKMGIKDSISGSKLTFKPA